MLLTAARWLQEADMPAVLTGAGISAESGIPTFRGTGGLWKNYRAEELATPQAFRANPALVWQWYHWRRELVRQKSPNAGHIALVELKKKLANLRLITQNVDGLHRRSGFPEHTEMHGYLFRDLCTACSYSQEDVMEGDGIPVCPQCGALLRPGVVWFGEPIATHALQELQYMAAHCDVLLVVGTSGQVFPAASLAPAVLRRGGRVVHINPEISGTGTSNQLFLQLPAGVALTQIADIVCG